MDKVLIILPDNNKGKYISKAYSSAFADLSYFVIEKKIHNLNFEEVQKIAPDVIFCFFSDMKNNDTVINFLESYSNENTKIIACSELKTDIPESLQKKAYCFSSDDKRKKHNILLGVNKNDYKEKFNGYKYSITFAGNPAYENRENLLSTLILNYGPINIFCRSFDFYKSVDEIHNKKLLDEYHLELYRASYGGYVENQKELSKIFISSKINIDIKNPSKNIINYRFFEILASGGFVLSPYNKLTSRYFEDGKEYETYSNNYDLIDKIDFYLKNLDIAQAIAQKGKKVVACNHSFYDRLKSMLKVTYGKNFSNR